MPSGSGRRVFGSNRSPRSADTSEERDLDAIRTGIRALGFKGLRDISDALDRAMESAEAERGFQPWLPAADKARATSRALQDLGDEEL